LLQQWSSFGIGHKAQRLHFLQQEKCRPEWFDASQLKASTNDNSQLVSQTGVLLLNKKATICWHRNAFEVR